MFDLKKLLQGQNPFGNSSSTPQPASTAQPKTKALLAQSARDNNVGAQLVRNIGDFTAAANQGLFGGLQKGIVNAANFVGSGFNTAEAEKRTNDFLRTTNQVMKNGNAPLTKNNNIDSTAGRIGQAVGQTEKLATDLASMVVPGAAVEKAVRGASLLSKAIPSTNLIGKVGRTVVPAVTGGAVSSGIGQLQSPDQNVGQNFGTGAALDIGASLLGPVVSTTSRLLRNPASRQAIKQAPGEVVKAVEQVNPQIKQLDETLSNYQRAFDVETDPTRRAQINQGIAQLNAQRRNTLSRGSIQLPGGKKFNTVEEAFQAEYGYKPNSADTGQLQQMAPDRYAQLLSRVEPEELPILGTNLSKASGRTKVPGTEVGREIPTSQSAASSRTETDSAISQPGVSLPSLPEKQLSTSASQTSANRSFIKTIYDDPNTKPEIRQALQDIDSSYKVRNTEDLQTKAANLANEDPDTALKFALGSQGDDSVAVGSELIKKLQRDGNYTQAIELAGKLAKDLTEAGRTAQAASIYGKLTPEGVLRYTQTQLDKYNRAMKLTGTKMAKLDPAKAKALSDRSEALAKMPEGREKDIASAELVRDIYDSIPSTLVQKISTLQTMAQLLNPKTAIRNVTGNAIFGGIENVSQTLAAVLDTAISVATKKRTVAAPNLKTQFQSGIKGGEDAYQEAVKGINLGKGTQFDLNDVPVFKGKVLGNLEKALNVSLRVPDRIATEAVFNDTVNGLMKVNKLSKPTEEILELANNEAMYRTFQDNSKAAQLFSKLKDGLNHVGIEQNGKRFGLGDFIIKYSKTPGNIISRGIDYSPLGIAKALLEVGNNAIKKEPFDQRGLATKLSRATVGTGGLIGAGAVLGNLGIITEAPEEDTDLRNLQKATGKGGYQINTSALRRFLTSGFNKDQAQLQPNDVLVSYDWAQPLSIPLSAGAALGKGQDVTKGTLSTLDNLANGLNTLVEQPLVTGIQKFASNIKNKGVIGALGATVADAPASFVPTAFNQARQLTDNTTRSTYDPNAAQESLNKVLNKIPGLAGVLPAQVDVLGREKENYQNGSNNFLNVLFNPSFVSRYQPTAAAQEAFDIYNGSGLKDQVPRTTQTSQKVNGEQVDITSQQNHDLQQYVGQKTNEALTDLYSNTGFQSLSDEEKAKRISNAMTDIAKAGKVLILGDSADGVNKDVQTLLAGNKATVDTLTDVEKAKNKAKAAEEKEVTKSTSPKKAGTAKAKSGKYDYAKLLEGTNTIAKGNQDALRKLVYGSKIQRKKIS